MSDAALIAKIELLEKQIKTEQGKNLAVVRQSQQIERDAKKTAEEAQAYRDETTAMIAYSADQLKVAWTIGHFIYSIARRAMDDAILLDTSAQILMREGTLIDSITALVEIADGGVNPAAMNIVADARKFLEVHKTNQEQIQIALFHAFVTAASRASREAILVAIKGLRKT